VKKKCYEVKKTVLINPELQNEVKCGGPEKSIQQRLLISSAALLK